MPFWKELRIDHKHQSCVIDKWGRLLSTLSHCQSKSQLSNPLHLHLEGPSWLFRLWGRRSSIAWSFEDLGARRWTKLEHWVIWNNSVARGRKPMEVQLWLGGRILHLVEYTAWALPKDGQVRVPSRLDRWNLAQLCSSPRIAAVTGLNTRRNPASTPIAL